MKDIRHLYDGREHSWIKHLFLTEYLQSAAFRIIQARSNVFNYVDGFAGPWNINDDENYSDSSFAHAIQVLFKVKAALDVRAVQPAQIRFCLCEKQEKRVELLNRYALRHPQLDIHVFSGKFEDRLPEIASVCRDGFTFSFIDPTGFDINSQELAQSLASLRGEFLFNFMSEHINRYPGVDSVNAAFGRLLADVEWRKRFDEMPSNWKNEERVLAILKERFKDLCAARFLPDFGIMNPRANRLQMRLVLGTNSYQGVAVFRDVQKKAETEQYQIREEIRLQGQALLFPMPDEIALASQRDFEVARDRLVNLLSTGPKKLGQLIGPVLEVAALRKVQLTDLLVELRDKQIVDFTLAARSRKPKDDDVIKLVRLG